MSAKRMAGIRSDTLVVLETLIDKTGYRWKRYLRDLVSVPLAENTYAAMSLKLRGLSEMEICDLSLISADFVKRATRPMILEELRRRRTTEGLLI